MKRSSTKLDTKLHKAAILQKHILGCCMDFLLYRFTFFFSFDLSDMELGERKHFPNIRWENVTELSEMHCKSCGKNVFSPQ